LKPHTDAQKTSEREHVETLLLKALIWKSPHSTEIIKLISPTDFSPKNRQIYEALLNMIDIGIDIKASTLKDALESDEELPFFDSAPKEKDILGTLELYKSRTVDRRKALDRIHEWKRNVDNLTAMVHRGELDPSRWMERIQSLMPQKKSEEKEKEKPKEPEEPREKKKPEEPPPSAETLIGAVEPEWSTSLREFEKGEAREFFGLRTGFEELDRRSLGLKGMIMMAGSPKIGKTTLALQLASEIPRYNNAISIMYSLEMDRKTLFTRTLSRIAGIPDKVIALRRWNLLKEPDIERLKKAKTLFNSYKNRIFLIDRTSVDVDRDQIFYQIDGIMKKTKSERVFIVIDSVPTLAYIGGEGDRMAGPVERMEKLMASLRLVSQIFNATVFLVFPKNYQPIMSESVKERDRCYDYVYSVDSFFELFTKSKPAAQMDYYAESQAPDEEIDLWATCRDTGRWYVPLTFSKAFCKFSYRKSGFKATKITWQPQGPDEQEEESPQG